MQTYYIDSDDNSNWARIGALKPGDSCRVMVRQEENRSAPSIPATGILRKDGNFVVTVDKGEENNTFDAPYLSVMETLELYRARRKK
jgi:hypothetical protein